MSNEALPALGFAFDDRERSRAVDIRETQCSFAARYDLDGIHKNDKLTGLTNNAVATRAKEI